MIQAIPTTYAGHKFRSRLEARWALFFDLIGIPWEYEREAFSLVLDDKAIGYTPDFWLPTQGIWFEVKPETAAFSQDETDAMFWKLMTFADQVAALNVAFGTPSHSGIAHFPHRYLSDKETQTREVTWARCAVCLAWDLGVDGPEETRMCGHVTDRVGHKMVAGAMEDATSYRFWNP